MNKKKLVTTLGSLALVGAIGVGATLAYLTSNTDPVTNTFTLSDNVKIVLDEQNYNSQLADRVTANEYENVVPDVDYPKDPTITLGNVDLDQYAFIAIDESAHMSIVDLNDDNWDLIDEQNGVKVYVYHNGDDYVVTANDDTIVSPIEETEKDFQAGIQLPALFTKVRVADNVVANAETQSLEDIKLAAAAIQAEGFIDTIEDGVVTKAAYLKAYDEVKVGLFEKLGVTIE